MNDEPHIPDDLPGIDPQASTLRKRPALFLKGLKRFKEDQHNFESDFNSALADNMEEATRLAHSLKGLAGTFGAVSLQQSALELELACKENRGDDIKTVLAKVIEDLHIVFSGIDSLN
jgi:two-component system sensor histidine kinase/response regulator